MKKMLVSCLTLFVVSIIGTQAWATALSFQPSTSSINVEETLDIDIVISDLDGSYVGAFDFDIVYDDAFLAFNTYSLTDNLGDISENDAEDWSAGNLGSGAVNIAEISWLSDLSFQEDSFILATLSFTGTNVGGSELGFSLVVIGDDLGDRIDVALETGSINVIAPTPEPTTIILFGIGIIGIAGVHDHIQIL